MSDHPLKYSLAVGPFEILLREVEGYEELSKPWKIEAKFALDPQTMTGIPEEFHPDDVIKQEARIIMKREDVPQRYLTGVITDCTLSATRTGVPEVEMTVQPRYALLGWRQDVRIHRNLNAWQIVEEVANALGVKTEIRLQDEYPNRPYCVQWRETDFDYCNRLMEDEGIFYFFTADDVMVLGDHPGAYENILGDPIIPFRAAAGQVLNDDAITQIGSKAILTPGKVTLRDWNTEHPSLDMDVVHDTALPFSCEWYDYPGEYEEPDEGARKARLHAEAYDCESARVTGASTCARLYPGGVFQLVDAPIGSAAGGHVVRKIEHAWNRDEEGWVARFEADFASDIFRPLRETYVPRIFNPHTGVVTVSSPGEDIHCDHFGRVKVHFHWDRLRPYDDDCSHWIPTIQDNTGGSSAIPREGWEVAVHYLEGDPDRPVVLGRVYNGEEKFTEKLPHAKDRSGLKSYTSPTRDGANEIRMEDNLGMERIYMHAIKDQNIRIANNSSKSIANTENHTVKNNETIQIGGDANWSVGDMMEPTVGNDQTYEVTGNRKINIGKSYQAAIYNDHKLKVTGNYERKIFTDDSMSCKNLTETFESTLMEKFKKVHNTQVSENYNLDIQASFTETIKNGKGENTTKDRIDDIKTMHMINAGEEYQVRCDETRKMSVKSAYVATVSKRTQLTARNELKTHSPTGYWMGFKDVTLRVKATEIMLKDGLVRFNAPEGTVFFKASASALHQSKKSEQAPSAATTETEGQKQDGAGA